MSLILSASACTTSDCENITFKETTGAYSLSNPNGWGAPNIDLSSVIETHIIITPITSGTAVVDILNPVGLPTDDTAFEYDITASVLNGGTYITDGLYTIEYTVYDGVDTYTTGPIYYLFTCNTDCCVASLFKNIASNSDCECESTVIKNALYAFSLSEGLKALKDCGNISEMNSILTKLNLICGFSTSGCGCN